MSYPGEQVQPANPQARELFVEGVRDLERGFFYQLIATALLAIASIAAAASILGGMFFGPLSPSAEEQALEAAMGAVAALGVVLLIAFIISIVSLVKILSGFDKVGAADPRYGIGRTGARLLIGSMGLLVLSVILAIAGVAAQSVGILVGAGGLIGLALLLLLIGGIMLLIALWRLGELDESSYIRIGLILNIIGGLVMSRGGGVLSLIGTVLIYLGLKNIRESLEAGLQAPSPAPTSGEPSYF